MLWIYSFKLLYYIFFYYVIFDIFKIYSILLQCIAWYIEILVIDPIESILNSLLNYLLTNGYDVLKRPVFIYSSYVKIKIPSLKYLNIDSIFYKDWVVKCSCFSLCILYTWKKVRRKAANTQNIRTRTIFFSIFKNTTCIPKVNISEIIFHVNGKITIIIIIVNDVYNPIE